MTKRFLLVLLALAVGLGLSAAPAQASASGVHSVAEWNAIKTVYDFHGTLMSPEAMQRRAYADCPDPVATHKEYLCLWNGYSFGGTLWKIPVGWLMDAGNGNPYNGLSFTGSGINNASKGWWNRTYQQVTLFDNESCQLSGWYRRMAAGDWAWQSDAGDADWENRIGSASLSVVEDVYCFPTPGT